MQNLPRFPQDCRAARVQMSVTVRTNTRSLSLAPMSSAQEEVGMGKLPPRSRRQHNVSSSGGCPWRIWPQFVSGGAKMKRVIAAALSLPAIITSAIAQRPKSRGCSIARPSPTCFGPVYRRVMRAIAQTVWPALSCPRRYGWGASAIYPMAS
jgi:hypothetical protein